MPLTSKFKVENILREIDPGKIGCAIGRRPETKSDIHDGNPDTHGGSMVVLAYFRLARPTRGVNRP
jgi:hypothetical protein